ncbi:MAG TPA: methionyl-tRNA formyltransferase [Halanaerobiales bacterium]|nr:methionyl-tRNA formyltransferase [Halanaerobiales bacterium]
MKIVFAGTPGFAVPSLKGLIKEAQINIDSVITQPDRRRGRGKKVRYTPVKKAALKYDLEVLQPENINDKDFIKKLNKKDLDAIVVVAYGQILSKEVLELPKYGCINLHASLLPEYRGSSPIQQAIIDGKEITGVTTMFMDEGLDTGDIIFQKKVKIKNEYNAGDLHDKLAEEGAELLKETLIKIENGSVSRLKQNEDKANYTSQLSKDDGLIDWSKSSQDLYYFVKGMNPWPGSFTYLNGKLLKIFEVKPIDETTNKEAGTVIKANPAEGLFIQTGDGLLKIKKLQLAGKKKMPTEDFLRGYEIEEGTKLEN